MSRSLPWSTCAIALSPLLCPPTPRVPVPDPSITQGTAFIRQLYDPPFRRLAAPQGLGPSPVPRAAAPRLPRCLTRWAGGVGGGSLYLFICEGFLNASLLRNTDTLGLHKIVSM